MGLQRFYDPVKGLAAVLFRMIVFTISSTAAFFKLNHRIVSMDSTGFADIRHLAISSAMMV
jgi:hypothetical protein